MEKILSALGLDAKATVDDAVAAINQLKTQARARAAISEREKKIALKMSAGLSREVAIEALDNQENENKTRNKNQSA